MTREWLPFDRAAIHFGYNHKESLRNRIRQLRERGLVVDTGNPPEEYQIGDSTTHKKIVLLWANPKTALVRSDASMRLLNPKKGKRTKKVLSVDKEH